MSKLIVDFPSRRSRSSSFSSGSPVTPREETASRRSNCSSSNLCSSFCSSFLQTRQAATAVVASYDQPSKLASSLTLPPNITANTELKHVLGTKKHLVKKNRHHTRSVSFSTTSELVYCERFTDNDSVGPQDIWYTKHDYKMMKLENRKAVMECHKHFMNKQQKQQTAITSSSCSPRGSDDKSEPTTKMDIPRSSRSCQNRDVNSTSSTETHQDEVAPVITGLERLLTPKIYKKSALNRRHTWTAVLVAQEKHQYDRLSRLYNDDLDDECNDTNWAVEDIAFASMKCTEWARKRAHTIGMLNAQDR